MCHLPALGLAYRISGSGIPGIWNPSDLTIDHSHPTAPMQFAHPFWLLLLILIPVPLVLERARPRILWPSFTGFGESQRRWSMRRMLRGLPPILRGLALGAMAVALARPQTVG